MKTILSALAVLALSCTMANATTFDFTGNGGLAASYNFGPVDGISVTATPGAFVTSGGGTVTAQGQIGQYTGGLGVTNPSDSDHQVDGSGWNDIVVFDFSQDVILQSVTFSYFGGNDDFSFFFDNLDDGDLDGIAYNVDTNTNTYTFNSVWNGDLFGIGALDRNDEFKIKSMTVSAIPLPAALPLYGAGLAVLGFIGWRRKRNQSS